MSDTTHEEGDGPLLSILVVSWNTRDLLFDCMASIAEFMHERIRCEVILVDNASTDGSVAMLRESYSWVRLVENSENVGFARAVNQAARQARGKYVLLFNSDAKLVDDSYLKLIDALERDETIGIVGGFMKKDGVERGPQYYAFPSFMNLVASYSLGLLYKRKDPNRGRYRGVSTVGGLRVIETDWVSGAYLLARKELVDDRGLLDPNIFMYYEDTLLCRKAWDRGFRVISSDTSVVLHEGGASAAKTSGMSSVYSYRSSRIYLNQVEGDTAVWWYERSMRLIWSCLILLMWPAGFATRHRSLSRKMSLFRRLLAEPLIK